MKINVEKFITPRKISENFRKFSDVKILVIGDIILDKFVWGEVERISPEAPVPVVEVRREEFMLGGAGNVALNIKNMDGNVFLISFAGKDEEAEILKKNLTLNNIDFFLLERKIPTILKTRVIAKTQQIVRIDREKIEPLKNGEVNLLKDVIKERIKDFDCIVVSDYGKGIINNKIMEFLKKFNKKIIVDPKPSHFKYYKKVTCLTPNKNEALTGIGRFSNGKIEDLVRTGIKIIRTLKCKNLIITLGKDGMLAFEDEKNIYHIPSVAIEVYDVTGAGDTVCGIFSLNFSLTDRFLESVIVSNFAAGIVVGKLGTATTNQKEFIDFFEKNFKNIFIEKVK